MASLVDLCRNESIADELRWYVFVQASNRRDGIRHGQIVSKQERLRHDVSRALVPEKSIFAECKGSSMRKRSRASWGAGVGLQLKTVRTGSNSVVVCKSRVIL